VRGGQHQRWEAASHFLRGFVSPSLSFPLRSGQGEKEGGERPACNRGWKENPPEKPAFRATSASSGSLNTRSHFSTQPIAEGDTPTPKNPSFPHAPKHKARRARELGGRQRCRRSREATLPLRALPAVSNHAPQGSEPAQIPNYFLLQCRVCIFDGVFPALAGEKRQPLCLPALSLLSAERSPGGGLGKQAPRLASGEGWGAVAKGRGCPGAHPGCCLSRVCREGSSCAHGAVQARTTDTNSLPRECAITDTPFFQE